MVKTPVGSLSKHCPAAAGAESCGVLPNSRKHPLHTDDGRESLESQPDHQRITWAGVSPPKSYRIKFFKSMRFSS